MSIRKLPRGRGKGAAGEERVGQILGLALAPGSGCSARKGDLRDGALMVEVKTTSASSYRLDLGDLRKLEREAAAAAREPALVVVFEGREYAVIPLELFERIRPREDSNQ